jgi:hypothetical protein
MSRHDLRGIIRRHPSVSAYHKGCRCEDCTRINRERNLAIRAALAARPRDEVPHGTYGGYCNWRCRCEACTAANTQQSRAYYRKQAAKAGAQ